jgi:hypothetical protein
MDSLVSVNEWTQGLHKELKGVDWRNRAALKS